MSTEGKRLYRVTIETEILVLADDDVDAEQIADSARRDIATGWSIYAETDAVESERDYPDGWDDRCLVYHEDPEDILVPEALRISEATRWAALSPEKREAEQALRDEARGQLALVKA